MIPTTKFTKVDGQTGVVRPGATGVLAIIAPATTGPFNSAGSYTNDKDVQTEHGYGRLHEFAAYVLPESGKPIVGVAVDATTDGACGTVTTTNPGTSAITAGATTPVDAFDVVVQFSIGATIGVAGAQYKYSLNGGQDFSKSLALGTANTIAIPNTGVEIDFGVGTVLATTKVAFSTTPPQLANADLTLALEALRVTSLPFDAVLIDMPADATTVTTCDQWLKALALKGKAKTVVVTLRPKTASETETQYRDAVALIMATAESTDVLVCGDACDLPSRVRGIMMVRPTGLAVAARGMQISVGTDPAWVELGPLTGAKLDDSRGNPKYHDEDRFPGLDDLRVTTLRTIPGFDGVFINNANLASASGSDFVYWQHARVANRGIEIGYQILTKQLSRGVRKNPKPGPNGERYISEGEARHLEELANAQIYLELVKPGECDDMKLVLRRDDDIRSNAGAKIRGAIQSVSLGYIKEFDIDVGYVTAIEAPAAGT